MGRKIAGYPTIATAGLEPGDPLEGWFGSGGRVLINGDRIRVKGEIATQEEVDDLIEKLQAIRPFLAPTPPED